MKRRKSGPSYGRRRGPSTAVVVAVVLVVLAVISLGLAALWQRWQDGPTEEIPVEPVAQEETSDPEEAPPIEEATLDDPEELEEPEEEPLEEENREYTPRPTFVDALPESPSIVGYEYFDDAIFFGDSISTGIPLYLESVLPEVAVVAKQNLRATDVTTAKVFQQDGQTLTALELAQQYGPRNKVYIMLGSNALYFSKEEFYEGYKEFVQAVKQQYPGATIYLQSMTPVTETPEQLHDYPDLNNAKINEYNLEIMRLAQEEGAHYLDVAVAFLNEDGILPIEASPDGVHFIGEYYYKWFDYLKKHTA